MTDLEKTNTLAPRSLAVSTRLTYFFRVCKSLEKQTNDGQNRPGLYVKDVRCHPIYYCGRQSTHSFRYVLLAHQPCSHTRGEAEQHGSLFFVQSTRRSPRCSRANTLTVLLHIARDSRAPRSSTLPCQGQNRDARVEIKRHYGSGMEIFHLTSGQKQGRGRRRRWLDRPPQRRCASCMLYG